ncbi:hydrolase, alpha/beta fold family [Neorickettsia risticii str. Illinois]|uniref:Hydrolase, alpha/beta fold family n=1 Tax=Neorickettsia risticii (strain Illinois) TaxID=434131 RepID=C6V5Y7_NEORI|nr:alpha/beta hydrolase [Neorickettsia risticii]ACT69801.1 hydrolase, alpha/beta fold family [Neorickettsia risticii str. Illinois]
MEKKSIASSFGKIVYLDWNHKGKLGPVICIHGINRNKRDFDYLARTLAESDFRVIAIDVPGRGESEYMQADLYTYENYGKILLEFINRLALQRCVLVGTSMGGIISMMLASTIPQKIEALVINDIGPYTDFSAMIVLSKYLSMYPTFSSLEEADKFLRVMLKPLGLLKEEHWQHMLRHSFRNTEEGKYVLDFDPEIFRNHRENITGSRDLWKIWDNINQNIPILALRGEFSRMLSKETFTKMAQSHQRISCVEYTGIGHAPSLMDHKQLEDIKSWLLANSSEKQRQN